MSQQSSAIPQIQKPGHIKAAVALITQAEAQLAQANRELALAASDPEVLTPPGIPGLDPKAELKKASATGLVLVKTNEGLEALISRPLG